MANTNPPKRGAAFSFEISLAAQATRPQYKASPTLAAGDVLVNKDGGAVANIGTLPTVIASNTLALVVALTGTEMTADRILLTFHDVAGAEWDDLSVLIFTSAQTFDDTQANITTILADYARRTGDYATVAALSTLQGNVTTILADYARRTGDYATVAALSTLQGNVTTILADYARRTGDYATVAALSALQGNVTTILADYARRTGDYSVLTEAMIRTATGMASADLDTQLDAILAASGGGGTPPTVGAIADAVWDELLAGHATGGSAGSALTAASAAGAGAILTTFTVNDATGQPLDGVLVEISTDSAKTNVIASGYTLTNGIVRLNLDPGSYYLWKNLAGYDFTNPQAITVSA